MENNQFKYSKYYYCYLTQNLLKKKESKILDIGCGNGECISKMNNISKNLYGYDVDKEKIKEAKKKYPHVTFQSGEVGQKLPYKNASFDVIFLYHVLEHVDSEKKTLQEIERILKPNGTLFLASPYKGLFSWADMANLRYRLPFIHKSMARIFYGKKTYEELFEKHTSGLYGDSSPNRSEHKHYKALEVEKLFKNIFSIEKFIKYSLFQPFLLIIDNGLIFIFKRNFGFMNWLIWMDNHIEGDELSNNMLVVAKKYANKK